jgi:hypothetical protein
MHAIDLKSTPYQHSFLPFISTFNSAEKASLHDIYEYNTGVEIEYKCENKIIGLPRLRLID